MNWSDAEHFCVSLDAHLASMEKPWDHDAIQAAIYSSTGTRTRSWVGGTDAAKEGEWTWSDGSPFTFTNWGPGQPNNSGGDKHCMEINLNGTTFK
ncbi:ladderlectin [Austrofundulus limnaeus]|uniref:Ladderlectin n=1 Tax=Austrofundulus limnaeus TaxID=52670 RepID=A0A2I4CMC6_AUSLI|nr:PREDICTED: ladderlectin-like [Austrofundulus limnaeus]